jgi:hypothetical protein
MILPTKHLSAERALLTGGARIIALLDEPRTTSALWDKIRLKRDIRGGRTPTSYDWFVLSLDLLFAIGAVEFRNGLIWKSTP